MRFRIGPGGTVVGGRSLRLLLCAGLPLLIVSGCAHSPPDGNLDPTGVWRGEGEFGHATTDPGIRWRDGPPEGSRPFVLTLELTTSEGRISGDAYFASPEAVDAEPSHLSVTGTVSRRSITIRLQPQRLRPITLRGAFPDPDTLEAVMEVTAFQRVEVVLVRVRDPGEAEE